MSEGDVDIELLFEEGREEALGAYLHVLHPADIAELFNHVRQDNWTRITMLLSPERLAEVIADLDEGQRESLGEVLSTERLIDVVDELESDDAADVLADLPEEKYQAVLDGLEDEEEIRALLAYDDDTAGGIMQTELCTVRSGSTVSQAIDAVRWARDEDQLEDILEVYVVDADGVLEGTLALQDLVLTSPGTAVSKITHPVEHVATPNIDQEEVARMFRKYDLVTVPVTSGGGELLGRITFDDVHDVIEEEASEDMMVMAGASTENLVYSNAFLKIAVHRLPWLGVSLLGALGAAKLVLLMPDHTKYLAAFAPAVMAMAGNLGSQSAMIITRGLAIGRVEAGNIGRTLLRESAVGVIIGSVAGVVVFGFVYFISSDLQLSLILGGSVLASMSAATMIGVGAPVTFDRLGVDPAIAAGPLVTTTCDVTGVTVYLLIATAALAQT